MPNDGAPADYWQLRQRIDPRYPSEAAKNDIAGCVALFYTINNEGKTQDIVVVDSYPQDIFNKTAVDALKEWRYKATASNSNREMVRTFVVLEYSLSNMKNEAEFLAKCSIAA